MQYDARYDWRVEPVCGTYATTTFQTRALEPRPCFPDTCQPAYEPTGESESGLQVTVYPNPVEQRVTVRMNPSVQEASIRLIGGMGRTLRRLVVPANTSERVVDMESLLSGAYLIELLRGHERKVIPLRKQ